MPGTKLRETLTANCLLILTAEVWLGG